MVAPSLQPGASAEHLLRKSLGPPAEIVMKKKATANMATSSTMAVNRHTMTSGAFP